MLKQIAFFISYSIERWKLQIKQIQCLCVVPENTHSTEHFLLRCILSDSWSKITCSPMQNSQSSSGILNITWEITGFLKQDNVLQFQLWNIKHYVRDHRATIKKPCSSQSINKYEVTYLGILYSVASYAVYQDPVIGTQWQYLVPR